MLEMCNLSKLINALYRPHLQCLITKKLSAVNELLEKYEAELERISGLIEIYEELSLKIPEMKSEFESYSIENIKKSIRVSAKIKTLIDVCS